MDDAKRALAEGLKRFPESEELMELNTAISLLTMFGEAA